MSEPVKVLPMAKLLRLAREKEERERAEREAEAAKTPTEDTNSSVGSTNEIQSNQASQTIVPQTIVENTIPQSTIVTQTIPIENRVTNASTDTTAGQSNRQKKSEAKNQRAGGKKSVSQDTIPKQTIVQQNIVDSSKGYYPVFNDISDRLIPELGLDPYQQAVLQRLYRLSRGWKSEECEVGLGTLAKYCVMSRSQVQRSVAKLIEKELIECLGSSKKGGKEGNRYRVLPGLGTIPRQTIPKETIV
ncbi:MAG: helix-turn-helix domain-containing protein, partial [Acidobacteriota bacterium]|nr:helix-turn-helix domain-containing protein [Acidobacteriota bacterium]